MIPHTWPILIPHTWPRLLSNYFNKILLFFFNFIYVFIFIHALKFILQSQEKTYNCDVCGTSFKRKDVLTKHKKTHKNGKWKESSDPPPPAKKQRIAEHYECNICCASFENVQELKDDFSTHQEENNENEEEYPDEHPLMEKVLGNALRVITFLTEAVQKNDFLQLFSDRKEDVAEYLENEINAVKWNMNCAIRFVKYDKDGNKQDTIGVFTSRFVIKFPGEDIDMLNASIDWSYLRIFTDCQEFQKEGSGWAVDEVLHLKLLTAKYKPLKGSQYFELPKKIAKTGYILNIQNKDDKCFLWSILAHLHVVPQNGYRVEKYIPYETKLNMQGITYPVVVKDVPKFEKQNDISVNVFGYEDGYYPLYIPRDQKERDVNLLLLEEKGKTHYCLIKNLNGMLYSQTKHKAQQYFCTCCLHGFIREDLIIAHNPLCETHGPQHTELYTRWKGYVHEIHPVG